MSFITKQPNIGRDQSPLQIMMNHKLNNQAQNDPNNFTQAFVFRNKHIVPTTKKQGPSKSPIRDVTPNRNTRGMVKTFYAVRQPQIQEDTHESQFNDETGNISLNYDTIGKGSAKVKKGDKERHSRDNKFKTLNARTDAKQEHNLHDHNYINKMNTLMPGEYHYTNDLKQRIRDQMIKGDKKKGFREVASKTSMKGGASAFPQINHASKGDPKVVQLESIYHNTPGRGSSKPMLGSTIEEEKRSKSTLRSGASNTRAKGFIDAQTQPRAMSQQRNFRENAFKERSRERSRQDAAPSPQRVFVTKMKGPSEPNILKLESEGSSLLAPIKREPNSSVFTDTDNLRRSPQPPSDPKSKGDGRSRTSVRERSPNKQQNKLDKLNSSDIVAHEYETNYIFNTSQENKEASSGNILIEDLGHPSSQKFQRNEVSPHLPHPPKSAHQSKLTPPLHGGSHQISRSRASDNGSKQYLEPHHSSTQANQSRESISDQGGNNGRGITHHKTQPVLDDVPTDAQVQNNKSIDENLRQTVDSQHDISYPDKGNAPKITIKNAHQQAHSNPGHGSNHNKQFSGMNFVTSPPFERKHKFMRKNNANSNPNPGMKKQESSQNLLDDFAEKSIKISSEDYNPAEMVEFHQEKRRSASKSPFDDILETSLMSYEKESSIVKNRDKKEIAMTVSMTKQLPFKRSKVIVAKGGHHGSSENNVISTGVTNSKNESFHSRDDYIFRDSSKKDDIELEFNFEEDLSNQNKKKEGATQQAPASTLQTPHPTIKTNQVNNPQVVACNSTKRPAFPLKVIKEEIGKDTIGASKDPHDVDVIDSSEFQRIVETSEDNLTPRTREATIKPLYVMAGNRLQKNPQLIERNHEGPEQQSTLSQKLCEDDDICVNGEDNWDTEIVNHGNTHGTQLDNSLTNI